MVAALPPLRIILANLNSGIAARNTFRSCRKSGAFPHIDGRSPKKALE
jgi:hypothetical protein